MSYANNGATTANSINDFKKMQESTTVPGMPRRACMQEWTAEEKEIFRLVQAVEKLGASTELTRCTTLLCEAREALANHLENQT